MFCYTTLEIFFTFIYFWWNHKESNYDIGAMIAGNNLNRCINPEMILLLVEHAKVTFVNF